jgi:hypothetical protein
MANLSGTYRNQGQWDEALALQEEVLKARKELLGERHPDTLTAMANLVGIIGIKAGGMRRWFWKLESLGFRNGFGHHGSQQGFACRLVAAGDAEPVSMIEQPILPYEPKGSDILPIFSQLISIWRNLHTKKLGGLVTPRNIPTSRWEKSGS